MQKHAFILGLLIFMFTQLADAKSSRKPASILASDQQLNLVEPQWVRNPQAFGMLKAQNNPWYLVDPNELSLDSDTSRSQSRGLPQTRAKSIWPNTGLGAN